MPEQLEAWPAGCDRAAHASPDDSARQQRVSCGARGSQEEPQEQHLARDGHQHPQELQLCPQRVCTAVQSAQDKGYFFSALSSQAQNSLLMIMVPPAAALLHALTGNGRARSARINAITPKC